MKTIKQKFRTVLIVCMGCLIAINPRPILASEPAQAPNTFSIVIDVSGSMNDAFPAPVQADLADGKQKILGVKRRLIRVAKYLPLNTRVIVTIFDHHVHRVCDITIVDEAGRQKLINAFESIQAGNGATLLWRSLDGALAEAITISKANPESSIRLLIYTDGEDSEKNPQFSLDTILAKYSKELRDTLQLDWVTLGFDMKPEEKAKLEEAKVHVTSAHALEDIVPLKASFELSKSEARVGEKVTLQSTSLGLDIDECTTDWGDGSAYETGTVREHVYRKAGDFAVRFVIKDAKGRRNQTSKTIHVVPSQPPQLTLAVPNEISVGEMLKAQARCADPEVRFQWLIDHQPVGTGSSLEWSPTSAGPVHIQLTGTDKFDQTSTVSKTVNAHLPAPPTAAFRAVPNQPKLGETLTLLNESNDTAVRFEWVVRKQPLATTRHASLLVDKTEPIAVALKVWDKFEQTSTTELTIEVAKPNAPTADFQLPDKLEPGQPGLAVDTSSGNIVSDFWYINGTKAGHGKALPLSFDEPRVYVVRREVFNEGGSAFVEKAVTVVPHPNPIAGFTLGAQQAFLGDTLTITDIAKHVSKSEFFVGDKPEPIVLTADSDSRFFTIKCERLGTLSIRQVVHGHTGTAELCQELEVKSRFMPAHARFDMVVSSPRAPAKVTFLNQSSGDVVATWFDPGDGSPVEKYQGAPVLTHTYEADEFYPVIQVLSADELALPPSQWQPAEPLRIAKPLSMWVRNLWWEAPTLFLVGLAGLVGLRRRRHSDRQRRRQMLNGILVYRRKGGDSRKHEFAGTQSRETVSLPNDERFEIEAQIGVGNSLEIRIELFRADRSVAAGQLEDGRDVTLGDYSVRHF